jgi:hypothetical protein
MGKIDRAPQGLQAVHILRSRPPEIGLPYTIQHACEPVPPKIEKSAPRRNGITIDKKGHVGGEMPNNNLHS